LSSVDRVRSLGGFFTRLGAVRPAQGARSDAVPRRPADDSPVVNSRALHKFLSYLGSRPAPVLLDLGPVVGSNVTFFGEQLNCKVYIEDLFSDLARHLRDGRLEELPTFLARRFTLDPGSVDGVLLWDFFDYLDRPSAQALARTLVRLLRDDGALLGFFGGAGQAPKGFTKFIVADESHLRQHAYGSAVLPRSSLPNRDIIKMFDGLGVTDSFLMKDGLREILFRKGAGGRPII
jgi:hypothetical protein